MRQLEALFNRLLPVRQKHKGRLLFGASPCKGQEGTHSTWTSLTQGLRFGQVASSPFQGRVKGNSGSASKRTRTKTAAQKRSLQCFTYRKQNSLCSSLEKESFQRFLMLTPLYQLLLDAQIHFWHRLGQERTGAAHPETSCVWLSRSRGTVIGIS